MSISKGGRTAAEIRFGLIGCGDIGIEDARALTGTAGARLVACYDLVPALADDAAAVAGAKSEPSLDSLFARADIDAVIVATPHDSHEAVVTAALDARKHVLLEKPLAQDLSASRRIVAMAENSQAKTGVIFPNRTDPRFRQARADVAAGLIGQPMGVVATYLVDKPPWYFHGGISGRAPSSWRLSKARAGGGFLIMNLIHQIDAVRALLGVRADSVYADMSPARVSPEIEDLATLVVRFGPTIASLVGAASVVAGGGQALFVWGDAGSVEVMPEYRLSTRAEPSAPAPTLGATVPATWQYTRAQAIERFAACVRDDSPVDVPLRDALEVQAIVEAAYDSACTGRPIAPSSGASTEK